DGLYPMAIQNGQHALPVSSSYSGSQLKFGHGSQTQGHYGYRSGTNGVVDVTMPNYRYQSEQLGDVFQLDGGDSKCTGLTTMPGHHAALSGGIYTDSNADREPSAYLQDIPSIGLSFNAGTIAQFNVGSYDDQRNNSGLSKVLSERTQAECIGIAEAFTIGSGEPDVDMSASLSGSSVVNNAILSLTNSWQQASQLNPTASLYHVACHPLGLDSDKTAPGASTSPLITDDANGSSTTIANAHQDEAIANYATASFEDVDIGTGNIPRHLSSLAELENSPEGSSNNGAPGVLAGENEAARGQDSRSPDDLIVQSSKIVAAVPDPSMSSMSRGYLNTSAPLPSACASDMGSNCHQTQQGHVLPPISSLLNGGGV
ncbi:hypothetical protein LPJ81_003412, partial [Coemansia sp. IMI 209127]